MIQEAVNTFLDSVTSRFFGVIDFVTDPFYWHYLPLGIALIIAITVAEIAIRFYFADIPWLRKVGGLAVLGIIIALCSYREGEKDGEARRKPVAKQPIVKGKPNDPWMWWN